MRIGTGVLAGILAFAWLLAGGASAHPPSILSDQAEKATVEEVIAFRKSVTAAIETKDAAALRRIYADGNQGLSLFWKSQPDDKSRYGINKKTDLVYDIELMDVKSRFVPIAEPKAENAAPVETTPAAPATPKSP